MVDLRANPFNLDDNGVKWVEDTLASMTLQEKIGQLFCPVGFMADEDSLKAMVQGIGIGGIMYRPGPAKVVQDSHRYIQSMAKIPLLLAANLEGGGNGVAMEGTSFGKPMQVAATDDDECGYRMGKVSCAEGAATGLNWSFAPIIDIDANFRNPITNLRTFGDCPDRIIRMASAYLRAADEEGLAVSIKHFPGDGMDERDQHLVTSVNSMSAEDWDQNYGRIYQALINQGAKTVMVGHISQPACAKRINPSLTDEQANAPATLSPELMQGLLRKQLGFNGMIVTDATTMLGFTTAMPREKAVPISIAIGCDMFLFNKSLEEDYEYMMKGYQEGILTDERLNEAITRILALKASLSLHTKQENGTLVPGEEVLSIVGCEKHKAWAGESANKAITLVKDTQNLLPLSPNKTKRVCLNVLQPDLDVNNPLCVKIKESLEKEGFEVTLRDRNMKVNFAAMMSGNPDPGTLKMMQEVFAKVDSFKNSYDLVLYVANYETASNNTVIRLAWNVIVGMGDDAPWFTAEVPTMFVSLANPYHLLDVSMIKTFINAYSANDATVEALIEKLMGRSEFVGKSPVDPFCGRLDTQF